MRSISPPRSVGWRACGAAFAPAQANRCWRSRLRLRAQMGYTPGMKTAVSVPDRVFKSAERLAKHLKKSRSQLYSEALAEYVARRAPDEVTEAYDRLAQELDTRLERPLERAARRALERSEW